MRKSSHSQRVSLVDCCLISVESECYHLINAMAIGSTLASAMVSTPECYLGCYLVWFCEVVQRVGPFQVGNLLCAIVRPRCRVTGERSRSRPPALTCAGFGDRQLNPQVPLIKNGDAESLRLLMSPDLGYQNKKSTRHHGRMSLVGAPVRRVS